MSEALALIDYGAGNLYSVRNALLAAGARHVAVTADPDLVRGAQRIVLPGVGSFRTCYEGLTGIEGLVEALEDRVLADGVPFLGICVGMQLLASRGLEYTVTEGLDWIPGDVALIKPRDESLKIPHMGWNTLHKQNEHPLLAGIPVGEIESISLEGNLARVSMRIKKEVPVRVDATVGKRSESLLGDYQLELTPGKADELLPENGQIKNVIDASGMEQLFGSLSKITEDVQAVTSALRSTLGGDKGAASMQHVFDNLAQISDQLNKTMRDNGERLVLVTNDLQSPAARIAALYKERWQIELFFKWIKQNLKIKSFLGENDNAVRIQLLTALITYLLVKIKSDATGAILSLREEIDRLRTGLFLRPREEESRWRRTRRLKLLNKELQPALFR